jgi:hypothetical protein
MFEAENPVLLAGLQRVAAIVGLAEAPTAGEADLALRSAEGGRRHPVLDVRCSEASVVVTITEQPSSDLWSVIFDLVGHLVPTRTRDATTWVGPLD